MGWFDDNRPGGATGGGTTAPAQNTTGLVQHGTPNADGTWTVNGQILTQPQYAQFVQSGTMPSASTSGTTTPTGGTASPSTAAPNIQGGDIRSQVAQYFQARGVTPNPSSVDYWASKWNEFGAKDPEYFNRRLAQADEFGGGGAGGGGGVGGQQLGGFYLPGAAGLGAGVGIPAPGVGIPVGGQGLWNGSDPTGRSSLAQLAADTLTSSPGYQARLQEGLNALQRSAAAKGTLLTGGTGKALARFGQDYAANEYANQYNRLLGEQQTAFGQGLQAQGQGFNQGLSAQGQGFGQQLNAAQLGLQGQGQYAGQLYNLANLGQNSAVQQGNMGQTYATQAGNLLHGQATNTTDLVTGAGNARAAGTLGAGNAWQQGLTGATNAGTTAAQQYWLYQLMQGRQGGTGTIPTPPYGYGVLA